MADFNNIFETMEKLRQGFEGLGDVKGDLKDAVKELRTFNKNSREAKTLIRTFNENSTKLIPLLERIAPKAEEGFDLLAKMDQNMDRIATLVGVKPNPPVPEKEDKG